MPTSQVSKEQSSGDGGMEAGCQSQLASGSWRLPPAIFPLGRTDREGRQLPVPCHRLNPPPGTRLLCVPIKATSLPAVVSAKRVWPPPPPGSVAHTPVRARHLRAASVYSQSLRGLRCARATSMPLPAPPAPVPKMVPSRHAPCLPLFHNHGPDTQRADKRRCFRVVACLWARRNLAEPKCCCRPVV